MVELELYSGSTIRIANGRHKYVAIHVRYVVGRGLDISHGLLWDAFFAGGE